jgi:predicted metal-dependent hydrolase
MRRLELVSRDPRALVLGSESVDYVLVRRRGRRGVGLRVDHDGLTVSAPVTMALARIEALVRESERWVLRKLAEWRARPIPRVEWRGGTQLPYLGATLLLTLHSGKRNALVLCDGELHATVRDPSPEGVQRAVVGWYKRTALAYLGERTLALAHAAGIAAPRLLLSSARTRWGSCNARREVRLSWRLLKARPALVDYVICHELAHLRHMNHSRAFWAEVERQCADYRGLRRELLHTDHLYRAF